MMTDEWLGIDKWADIITRLTEKTKSSELTWRESQFVTHQFELVLPGQMIKLGEHEEGVSLSLYNEQGRLINTITTQGNIGMGADMQHLMEVVQWKVLKVDEALDQLKKALS